MKEFSEDDPFDVNDDGSFSYYIPNGIGGQPVEPYCGLNFYLSDLKISHKKIFRKYYTCIHYCGVVHNENGPAITNAVETSNDRWFYKGKEIKMINPSLSEFKRRLELLLFIKPYINHY